MFLRKNILDKIQMSKLPKISKYYIFRSAIMDRIEFIVFCTYLLFTNRVILENIFLKKNKQG